MKLEIGNIKRNKKIYAGDNEYPKILASIGVSSKNDSVETEIQKAKTAQRYGADILIDHSLTPNHYDIQKSILENVDMPLSAIAVYDVAANLLVSGNQYFTEDDVLRAIERKAELGVDLITLHASVWQEDLRYFHNNDRIIPCTSRGGTMVLENIKKTGKDNFYYTHFDEILKIAKKYNITLSLGCIFRAANIYDAIHIDNKYWEELERNAGLAKRASDAGVSIMLEGIGHCPLNLIPEMVKKAKSKCGVPYRVLTVATDSGLGFDHVSSAVAASAAVAAGADLVTAVSRSEHLGLPTCEDLKEAVISAKIAAHCGYIARSGDISLDKKMSTARSEVGCRGSVDAAIVPAMTAEELRNHKIENGKKCTMCGEFCALSSSDRIKEN